MRTKEEAIIKVKELLSGGCQEKKGIAFGLKELREVSKAEDRNCCQYHFGKIELVELLNYLYRCKDIRTKDLKEE